MDPKPTIFEFASYKFEPEQKRIFFNYKQEFKGRQPLVFCETLILPEIPDLNGLPSGSLDKVLQGVHLILGISYYKFYCATIVRHNYALTRKEANFWNIVYKKGLGEFYFRNNLYPRNSPKFSFNKNKKSESFRLEKNAKCLVAVSGGKDSIVAAELLKDQEIDITAVFTETQRESQLVNNVIKILGVKALKFRRILDEQVHKKHKHDGHVPTSAMFAFLGILYSVLYKYSYCIMANEYSSNFGNIEYKNEDINHQWSKSSEFENIFSNYIRDFITPDVKYFSLLRPFYEIRIAQQFSKYKKYFPDFSSCNKNFTLANNGKNGLWCGECAKCVFVFNLLSAFLTKKELLNIFKKNLYQDKNLLPTFKDIFGLGKMKPFDCVGTFEESKAAFKIGSKNFKADFIAKELSAKVNIKKSQVRDLFLSHKSPNIPPQFRFFGMKNVLILGYGKEGRVSKKYIKKFFPQLKIGIVDQKLSKDYLKKQGGFDVLIKTPLIPKEKVTIPYTTATNIFFSEIKKLGNKTIGITGSKGKSTTASLIFAILKEDGKNVRLIGNIGNPMLGALLDPVAKDEIFVIELSSYQLDDIEFSPDIAVITNLFPEHMDYHKSIKNYFDAKKNIINFQNNKDIFIYNQKNKKLCQWAMEARGKVAPFADEKLLRGISLPLIGNHNKENIRAAIAVAKGLGVSEKTIKNAVEKFKPLPHRLEFVGEYNGIKFFDDAISTTPESTIMAIKSLKNVGTIFLGGQDRGYDFSDLEKIIRKYKIKNVVLFPVSGKRILKSKNNFNVLETRSMEKAVGFAYKNTDKGKICLLSCASPSYSLWKNFEEKGIQFKKFVKKLN